MKGFQVFVLGLFGFFLIVGAITFATYRGGDTPSGDTFAPVTIWGTLPASALEQLSQYITVELGIEAEINYREILPDAFDQELVEGLASGAGPDMIFLPQDLIVRHSDKVVALPYESFTQRDFRARFIEEGELYLGKEGTLAFPFTVDPLVLYWNRTLFSNAGIAAPPVYWDELRDLTQRLTRRDEEGRIMQSAIALGEFENVTSAKEILVTLMLQAGNPLVAPGINGLHSVLSARFDLPQAPADAALSFYTEFANPVQSIYSWDRSLRASQEMFLAGDLALYIGFASELFLLQAKNPNLNFDVAPLPQISGSTAKKTFAAMQGIAVLKSSPNTSSAFRALSLFARPDVVTGWSEITGLPPVQRGLLSETQTDPYTSVFYEAALIADAFLDPHPENTRQIMQNMVQDVTSGRKAVGESILDAEARMNQLFLN